METCWPCRSSRGSASLVLLGSTKRRCWRVLGRSGGMVHFRAKGKRANVARGRGRWCTSFFEFRRGCRCPLDPGPAKKCPAISQLLYIRAPHAAIEGDVHGTRRREGSQTGHLGHMSHPLSRCTTRSLWSSQGRWQCRRLGMDHRLRPAACRSSDSWPIGRL